MLSCLAIIPFEPSPSFFCISPTLSFANLPIHISFYFTFYLRDSSLTSPLSLTHTCTVVYTHTMRFLSLRLFLLYIFYITLTPALYLCLCVCVYVCVCVCVCVCRSFSHINRCRPQQADEHARPVTHAPYNGAASTSYAPPAPPRSPDTHTSVPTYRLSARRERTKLFTS